MARVEKTRNNNTMSEAAYWGMVRSGLRRTFRFWKPIVKAKLDSRRAYKGPNKRQKWEHQCAHCKEWFKATEVEVDHILEIGSLRCGDDLKGFLERLTPEDGYQILCKPCHQKKTNAAREEKKNDTSRGN